MSDPSTKEGVKTYRAYLSAQSLAECKQYLGGVGTHFTITLPADIDDQYVLDVHALLNDLYIKSVQEGWSIQDQYDLIEAVSMVGNLVDIINRVGKQGKQARGTEFFRIAKHLGRLLSALSMS